MDVSYHSLTHEVNERLSHPRFDLVSLGACEVLLQYGCSARATVEPIGYPILRMNNLQTEGWDLEDLKYVELSAGELARWRLMPGDIVLNRTNSKELVGKCEVFNEPGAWVFASYLMRLRVDTEYVIPAFVTAFLSTRAGRVQIDRESRQIIGMSNINADEVRTIRVPMPKPAIQRELLRVLDEARTRRRAILAKAEGLAAGLETFVLAKLGLTIPPPDSRTVYATRLGDGVRQRVDPNFHTPRYKELQRRLEQLKAEPMGSFVRPSQERQDPKGGPGHTFRYIEIAGVSAATGDAVAVETPRSEAPSRARMVVRTGDIIVSLTRPQRGSIAMIGDSLDGAIASTGFAVLRDLDAKRVRSLYLWAFLRTDAARLQMLQRSSGGNYPAITEDELGRVLVPLPMIHVQDDVAAEVVRRRQEAAQLRTEADALWNSAKEEFERALLGRLNVS